MYESITKRKKCTNNYTLPNLISPFLSLSFSLLINSVFYNVMYVFVCVLDKRYLRSFTLLSLSFSLTYSLKTSLSLIYPLPHFSPTLFSISFHFVFFSSFSSSSWTRSSDFCFVLFDVFMFCVLQITDWGRDLPKKKIIITAHVPFRYPYSPALLARLLQFTSLSSHSPTVWPLRAMTSFVHIKAKWNGQMTSWGKARAPLESVLMFFFIRTQNKQTMTVRGV